MSVDLFVPRRLRGLVGSSGSWAGFFGCHAMKAPQPFLETGMIGIDVVDVDLGASQTSRFAGDTAPASAWGMQTAVSLGRTETPLCLMTAPSTLMLILLTVAFESSIVL